MSGPRIGRSMPLAIALSAKVDQNSHASRASCSSSLAAQASMYSTILSISSRSASGRTCARQREEQACCFAASPDLATTHPILPFQCHPTQARQAAWRVDHHPTPSDVR